MPHSRVEWRWSQTEDLGVVVRHVRRQVGRSSPLFAVGYSLGAGVLVRDMSPPCSHLTCSASSTA